MPTIDEIDSLGADLKYFHFHGIKIHTRKFGRDHLKTTVDGAHRHTVSMNTEISAVLTYVQDRLGRLRQGAQAFLFPSNNCGIDVHFYNGPNGFPFTTVKKTAYMTVAWQRLFDSLHATHRITNEPLFNSGLDVHLDAWLAQIKRAPALGSMIQLLKVRRGGICSALWLFRSLILRRPLVIMRRSGSIYRRSSGVWAMAGT